MAFLSEQYPVSAFKTLGLLPSSRKLKSIPGMRVPTSYSLERQHSAVLGTNDLGSVGKKELLSDVPLIVLIEQI